MDTCPRSNFSVKWFMDDLAYRIVAKSGIPSDRHHLGKLMHQSLNDDPSFILQIDGSTGLTESGGLVLERSIKCAIAMKKVGLKAGDVIAMMVPNHLDVCVPIYAALFLGVATAPIDINLGTDEIQNLLTITKPKVIFCQNDNVKRLAGAIKENTNTT